MKGYMVNNMKIEQCESAQRIGNTVILNLKEQDGTFKKHYHRYKNEDKAEYMLNVFGKEVEKNGGLVV